MLGWQPRLDVSTQSRDPALGARHTAFATVYVFQAVFEGKRDVLAQNRFVMGAQSIDQTGIEAFHGFAVHGVP